MRVAYVAAVLLMAVSVGHAWALPRGGTGIQSSSRCGPDSAPAPAAQWGMTCEVMDVNFSSASGIDPANGNKAIDADNTLQPGFDLYINNSFPSIINPGTWGNMEPTPPDAWSVSNNALTIAPTSADSSIVAGDTLYEFSTCGYDAGGGPGDVVGTSFTNGFYVDVSVGAAAYSSGPLTPSAWMAPTEFTAQFTGTSQAEWNELDSYEADNGRHIHDWNRLFQGSQETEMIGTFEQPGANTTYGMLVVPASLHGGGTGLIAPYTNDTYDASDIPAPGTLVSATAAPNPNGGNGGVGTFATAATQHECLNLTAGFDDPMTVTAIRVWQRP
jgi:hypothetical protein